MVEEGPAPVDLEKELTCSICTDLLYQPLTLLDCLHTFCGACLKEWFSFQASTATCLHPYTCPSCRASVRSTQPNATVTTLLDMFIQANPERGKSEEDKKADREKFKYGDNVLPKLRRRGGDEMDEEERRVLEDVQALSLREVGIETGGASSSNNLELPRERRRRERSRDGRSRSSDTRRSREEGRSRNGTLPAASASREVVPPRVIEHQSSLRSLLSASELDSQEMEEEIMRQIMEEGLLDGIDLNNIDVAQEDEISERIAQAYQQRQTQRQRERRERRERLAREGVINTGYSTPPDIRSPPMREDDHQRRRHHGRSESGTSTPRDRERDNRPPISRPGLLDVANQGTRHTRSSSQGSSRSTRGELRVTPLNVSSRQTPLQSQTDPIARLAPETTERPRPSQRRRSDNQQHSTLAERQQFRTSIQTSSNPDSPRRTGFNMVTSESPTSTVAVVSSPLPSAPASSSQPTAGPRRTTDPAGVRQLRRTTGTPPTSNTATFSRSTTDPITPGAQSRLAAPSATIPTPTLYPEPRVSCNSCGKDHIEYDLHYNCSRCDQGTFNLCQPCYRSGKGCKHWYGFGWAAWPAYQKKAPPGGYPPSHEYPHVLRGHRYRRPQGRLTESPLNAPASEEDPNYRLEEGVFCDICSSWANACYWKCDYCNEGEWGYCNDCVNQSRHCTHALLPLTHVGKEQRTPPSTASESASASTSNPPSNPQRSTHLSPPYPEDSPPTTPPVTPKSASLTHGPGHMTLANSTYRPLTFTVLCNICTFPIPPSHTRFHCAQCTDGDYDICSPCYKKLCMVGKISEPNGINGWRRCLRGHRMIVVGFEDRDGGQRRVVVRDLVGGLSLREEEITSPMDENTRHNIPSTMPFSSHNNPLPASQRRFPPDGGVGLRVQARWSYFPAAGTEDELSFPRFAEITEAEDINGDWFWGVYAGSKGLFPGNYGRVVGGNAERQGLI